MMFVKIASILLLTIVSTSGAQQMPLTGKSASQGMTLNGHEARLAVDGNLETYALSGSPMVPLNMAWWTVDLGGTYPIRSVQVWNAYGFENGVNYSLESFDIIVIAPGNFYLLCHRYDSTPFGYGESKTFHCKDGPISGTSIYFKKLSSGLRTELAIAEVSAFVGNSTTLVDPKPATPLPTDVQNISVVSATQSSDLALFGAYLAADGNLMTYSAALSSGANPYAWWLADLGSSHRITGVQLITGPDYTSAQYLQSISIDASNFGPTEDPTFSRASNCNSRSSSNLLTPTLTLDFNCGTTPVGRYLIVRRIPGDTFRTDVLSIAEILIRGYKT